MGFMDKAKFWKKDEDDFGDLGDFGLDDLDKKGSPGTSHPSGDAGLDLPEDYEHPHFDDPVPAEEVQPSAASARMSQDFGLGPSGMSPRQDIRGPASRPVQQMVQHPIGMSMGPQSDLAKDIEIIHAKLDAIRSSLDAINQRLATLERIAQPDRNNRYSW